MTTFCICCFRVYAAVSNMNTRFASSEFDSFRFIYVNTHNPIIKHFNLDAHSFMHVNNWAITACLFSLRFFAPAPTVSQLIDYLIDYLFREFFSLFLQLLSYALDVRFCDCWLRSNSIHAWHWIIEWNVISCFVDTLWMLSRCSPKYSCDVIKRHY